MGEEREPVPKLSILRVLVLKEGDHYVAQCLEIDIATQAKSIAALKTAFVNALIAQIVTAKELHQAPLAHLTPAPQCYFDMWDKAEPLKNLLVIPVQDHDTPREAQLAVT